MVPTMRMLLVTSVLVMLSACGRTPEPRVACPAPADDCATLLEQQQQSEAIYIDNAVRGQDVGAAERREAGVCVQLLTDRVLDLGCAAPCDELCRLHPCAVLDESGARLETSACVERCTALVGDQSIVADDLAVAVDKAAENPGFCTCRACVSEDDALCTQLFDCAID